jgi:hypothetical protein
LEENSTRQKLRSRDTDCVDELLDILLQEKPIQSDWLEAFLSKIDRINASPRARAWWVSYMAHVHLIIQFDDLVIHERTKRYCHLQIVIDKTCMLMLLQGKKKMAPQNLEVNSSQVFLK